jgi:hypothetical protein
VSAVAAIVKGRDSCALVFKCPGDATPITQKMAGVLEASARQPRGKGKKRTLPPSDKWKEVDPGVYLWAKSRSRGQLLTQLSENLVLWSPYDDAKGSLGLEVLAHWKAEPEDDDTTLPAITDLVSSARGALLSWIVLRPGSLHNDGVSYAITRLRNIGLKSIKGRARFDQGLYQEEAVYQFADEEAASRFAERAQEEETDEHKVVVDFTTPLEQFTQQKEPPARFPQELAADGEIVRASRQVRLPLPAQRAVLAGTAVVPGLGAGHRNLCRDAVQAQKKGTRTRIEREAVSMPLAVERKAAETTRRRAAKPLLDSPTSPATGSIVSCRTGWRTSTPTTS